MPTINLNFPKPYNVFNKQIYDSLFDYSHFIEVWYGGASSGKSHGVVQKVVLKVLIQFQSWIGRTNNGSLLKLKSILNG